MSTTVLSAPGTQVPPEVEELVHDRIAGLDQYPGQVPACRVVVDVPRPDDCPRLPARVRLEIYLPGEEWTIRREADRGGVATLLAAAGEAFDAAEQLLADDARCQGRVGTGPRELTHGRVRVVECGGHCGLIETADGRMVEFREDGLVNADLRSVGSGTEVVFVEETRRPKGRASDVRVLHKGRG